MTAPHFPNNQSPIDNVAVAISIDIKYQSYIEIYKSLDLVMWQNIATLMAVTGVGFNVVAALAKDKILVFGISTDSSIGIVLFIMSILYLVTIFAMARFRIHHKKMDIELSKLEGTGYFRSRTGERGLWLSAVAWNMFAFGALAIICTVGAEVEFTKGHWLWVH